jgi:hypothetical protein
MRNCKKHGDYAVFLITSRKCKLCVKDYFSIYRKKHRVKFAKQFKERYSTEKHLRKRKEYYLKNKEIILQQCKEWRKNNHERFKNKCKEYHKKYRNSLNDTYIKKSFLNNGKSKIDLPEELIKSKRLHILLKRKIKELKNANNKC